MSTLPNFIIGGSSASGTSFLSSILLQHKDIYLPKVMRPEPHFFYYTHKFNQGLAWYQQQWFSEYAGQHAVGERSSSYLYHRLSAERIREHLPDIKLIFILRNPVERAWANYRYTVLSGLETLSFEQALDKEQDRIKKAEGIWAEVQPHDYTGRSYYGRQIQMYLSLFNEEQILVLSSEKLGQNPQEQVAKITKFLEVEPFEDFFVPDSFTSPNVKDSKVQAACRDFFGAEKFNSLIENIRKKGKQLSALVETSEEHDMLSILQENLTADKQSMSEASRQYLTDLFMPDQALLFELIGNKVDFQPWL